MEVKQKEPVAITEIEASSLEELATEGYRLLDEDTADYAIAEFSLALEWWPEWEENNSAEEA